MLGLNPLQKTVELLANMPAGTDEEPQQWDSQTRTSRLRGWLARYKFLVGALALLGVALLIFFVPVLPSAHRNGWTVAGGLWAVSLAAVWVKAQGAGLRRLAGYELNILHMGNAIRPRLVERTGAIDDKTAGLKVLKQFDMAGLRTGVEQFRDRFGRREVAKHKEKYSRVDDDGSGDVIRGIATPLTAEADQCEYGIELFDGISVTHTGEERDLMESKERDTETTIPPVLDARTTADVRGAFASEAYARDISEQKLTQLENYIDELEEYVDPGGDQILQQVMDLVETTKRQPTQQQQPDQQQDGLSLSDFATGGDDQ